MRDKLISGRTPAVADFTHDDRGTSAVEFALVAFPFILMLLMTLQIGMYFMVKSSLDAGVVATADSLVNTFNSGATPTIPNGAALKALVATKSGGMVHNDTTLAVDMRLFATLSAAVTPISDGTVDTSVANSVLALRAQATVPLFMPGVSTAMGNKPLMVRSSALIRRQGY